MSTRLMLFDDSALNVFHLLYHITPASGEAI